MLQRCPKWFVWVILFSTLFISSECDRRRRRQREGISNSSREASSNEWLKRINAKVNTTDTTRKSKKSVGSRACECMEYWTCAAKNGQPYSYCGISDTEVCCFLPESAEVTTSASNSNENEQGTTEPIRSVTEIIFTNKSSSTASNENDREYESSTREPDSKYQETEVPSDSDFQPITIVNSEVITDRNSCGKQQIDWRLDSEAQFKEWPWHVAILEVSEDLYICGGALISPNRILTAAHCIQSYKNERSNRLKIRAGEYDVSNNDEPEPHVEVLVNMVAIHPLFNNASLANDIAILGLSRKIKFEKNIQPLCLPPWGRIPKGQCVVTGWGRKNEDSDHSIILKEVVVPLWNQDQCEKRLQKNFGPNYKLSPATICAGAKGKDACDGDGGGPMVCLTNGKWVHEGVVSFGVGCGRAESPGVYTRVSAFTNWIQNFL